MGVHFHLSTLLRLNLSGEVATGIYIDKQIPDNRHLFSKTLEEKSFHKQWAHLGSNQGPTGYEPVALPAELWAHNNSVKREVLHYPLPLCQGENSLGISGADHFTSCINPAIMP